MTSPEKCQSRAEISGEKLGWFYTCLSRGQVDLRVTGVATYLGQPPPAIFAVGGFFYELMATEESISPREFCGSRAVWLGDSHKHSNCGEKAEATDGRVLHQSAHGRSERAGGVLGRGRRPAGSPSLRRTSDLVGDGSSPGMVAGYAELCRATARSIITGRGRCVSALVA